MKSINLIAALAALTAAFAVAAPARADYIQFGIERIPDAREELMKALARFKGPHSAHVPAGYASLMGECRIGYDTDRISTGRIVCPVVQDVRVTFNLKLTRKAATNLGVGACKPLQVLQRTAQGGRFRIHCENNLVEGTLRTMVSVF